jgi:hypothetical protein
MELSRKVSRHGFLALGQVGGGFIRIEAGVATIALSVEEATALYRGFLEELFSSPITDRVS